MTITLGFVKLIKLIGKSSKRDVGRDFPLKIGVIGYQAVMKQGFPIATKGMTIGLLGGSFDPAHEGHVHITREALKRLGLDRVWWLVSPGNPLKARQPAPMATRIAQARRVLRDDPRVEVSDLETRLGTRYTYDTIAKLRELYPQVHFVWLMGADNLAQFHRWGRWREIMGLLPVAVTARPGANMAGLRSKAARQQAGDRLKRADLLAGASPVAWTFLAMPMNGASSSAIRAKGAW